MRAALAPPVGSVTREEKKVLAATMVGTAIEWYDYFIFAQAAGLVLGPLFFAPIAQENPALAQIISFATIGISFLFRPLGAIVCRLSGRQVRPKGNARLDPDPDGRSTMLIGLLPTYAQIGVWAPILLVLLRLVQGFSAGGEWGGAALMAVEHAPVEKRSFFGVIPADRRAARHDHGDRRPARADGLARQGAVRRVGLAPAVPVLDRADHRWLAHPPHRRKVAGVREDAPAPQGVLSAPGATLQEPQRRSCSRRSSSSPTTLPATC